VLQGAGAAAAATSLRRARRYVNAHVKTASGREFSVFTSFFVICGEWLAAESRYARKFALTTAVIDVEKKQYLGDSVIDRHGANEIKTHIERHDYAMDPRVERALYDIVSRGNVPLPDRAFPRDPRLAWDKLDLDFCGNLFRKQPDGSYHVKCVAGDGRSAFDLVFRPQKRVAKHGHEGVVRIGRKGDDMYYYFISRLEVAGTVTVRGESFQVTGRGWYDHEFGGTIRKDKDKGHAAASAPPSALAVGHAPAGHAHAAAAAANGGSAAAAEGPGAAGREKRMDYGWNWISLQLSDGSDITATTVVNEAGAEIEELDNFAIVVDADSTRHLCVEGTKFTPLRYFTSVRTTQRFVSEWRLEVPAVGADLHVTATFEDQELLTLIAGPSFWEGRVEVRGTLRGTPVSGLGFVERHGFRVDSKMDQFLKRVSSLVAAEVARLLPLDCDDRQAAELITSPGFEHLMRGVDVSVFRETVIKPIREIIDRGGKSWRSYSFLLCVDCVGGDSAQYAFGLAMPEIMHVGSLIIDDIQDQSETRRGGPTAHKLFGEALAINAGTAAYFIGLSTLLRRLPHLSSQTVNRLYDTYMLTLRAGHAGQAFDIRGQSFRMEEAVESGDNMRLREAVECTHRLKSAVPAGNLARMGALLGGGSEAQIEALGRYFEALGVAFQIIDDVLNLRGFEGKGKERGEDVKAGKVTYPIAVAMDGARLPLARRQRLWDIVQSRPQDAATVDEAVRIVEECGANAESERYSREIVNAAFAALDPLIPDSIYKVNLRAFGLYVLERHY
jgi:geranylgeranyl pyrophosphate synthase